MSICDVPVISNVCDTAGEQAAVLVAAPFEWAASMIGQAAAWMFTNIWGLIDTTTLVDVTNPTFVKAYNVIFGIAVFVMLIFFFLQLIAGLIRRDPSALTRAALGLAKSILGSFLAVTLIATLLEIVDQLTIGIVQASGTTMQQMNGRIGLLAAGLTVNNFKNPGVGAIITIFLGSLAIAAAAVVWFSLLIRKALLLVTVVLAPIALSGASWDAARGWLGRWASFVLALIMSKLVVVVVFLVAVSQTASPIELDLASIADPVAGIVLMFVAAFAPYMTYKFIAFVGHDIHHATLSEQESKAALNRPIPIPGGGLNMPEPKKVLDGGSASGTVSGAPTGAGPGSGSAGSGGGVAAAESAAGAAGPVGAAVAVGTEAAAAGPKAGRAVGSAADAHAAEASDRTDRVAGEASPATTTSANTATSTGPASSDPQQPSRHEPSPIAAPEPILPPNDQGSSPPRPRPRP